VHEIELMPTKSQESRDLFERVKVATRLSAELSRHCADEPEEIKRAFEELAGKPVGDSFVLIPPFYADHGLNITVGSTVFIGYDCTFSGHAAIDIGDEVMIAHKVNLVTSGHPVAPEERRNHMTAAAITIARNVWIGAGATVLPGVTIGAGSVIAAGAVVSRDVPPATLVGGVPAAVIRSI
jgi:acetyltransferase-like isoleucine patch superfamily enzyme